MQFPQHQATLEPVSMTFANLINASRLTEGTSGSPPTPACPHPTPFPVASASASSGLALHGNALFATLPTPPTALLVQGTTFLTVALVACFNPGTHLSLRPFKGSLCTHQPRTRNKLCLQKCLGTLALGRPSDGNGNRTFHTRKKPVPFY